MGRRGREFGSAFAGLADVLAYEVIFSFAEDPKKQAERAILNGQKAVEMDAEDPQAHLSLGRAYGVAEQYENAIHTLRKALQLNPYFALAHYSLGNIYIVIGRLDAGIGSRPVRCASLATTTPTT